MSQIGISIISTQSEDSELVCSVERVAKHNKLSVSKVCGSYETILQSIGDWAILPEVVFIDIPYGRDVFKVIEDMASKFPEGAVELVLSGVENDIKVYRRLRESGVAEVFPADPTEDDLAKCIKEIANKELKNTEIDPRRAVYVWSAGGGAGGTTLAMALARHASKEGNRTLYLDLDIYSAPGSYMFRAKEGANETYGLIEALMSPSRVDSIFLERSIQRVDKNLFYLSARKKSSDDEFKSEAVAKIIAKAQKTFDLVIVDTPWRSIPSPDWGKVHGTSIIVAAPNAMCYLAHNHICKSLDATPSREPIYSVVNRSGEYKSNDFTKKMFKEVAQGEVIDIPYDPAVAGRLFFEQKTIVDLNSRATKAFKRLIPLLPYARSKTGADKKSVLSFFGI